jgi:hypothetical protein
MAQALLLKLTILAVFVMLVDRQDFSVPDLKDGQASRFATILFYLNEVTLGGETAFPLWVNAETTEQLVVKPEVGKAVLFYNQLPDGNYDERSQHASLPVIVGTKWLTNLWVWVRTQNVNIYQCHRFFSSCHSVRP